MPLHLLGCRNLDTQSPWPAPGSIPTGLPSWSLVTPWLRHWLACRGYGLGFIVSPTNSWLIISEQQVITSPIINIPNSGKSRGDRGCLGIRSARAWGALGLYVRTQPGFQNLRLASLLIQPEPGKNYTSAPSITSTEHPRRPDANGSTDITQTTCKIRR